MIRSRLSVPHVVSFLALFVALGGTGYAVSRLPANSVSSRQVKDNSLLSRDIRDGSLQARDFASGTLLKGDAGAAGAPGPKGDPGDPGAPGAPGAPGPTFSFSDTGFVDTAITGPIAQYAAKTVSVPRAGRLVLNVSVDVYQSGAGTGQPGCAIFVDDNQVSKYGRETTFQSNEEHQLALTGAFDVPAAGSHNVNVRCGNIGAATVRFYSYDITGVLTGA